MGSTEGRVPLYLLSHSLSRFSKSLTVARSRGRLPIRVSRVRSSRTERILGQEGGGREGGIEMEGGREGGGREEGIERWREEGKEE